MPPTIHCCLEHGGDGCRQSESQSLTATDYAGTVASSWARACRSIPSSPMRSVELACRWMSGLSWVDPAIEQRGQVAPAVLLSQLSERIAGADSPLV